MTKGNIALAISALETLLGDRLSTGESIREIHGRDEAYSTPALPDAVAFPESTEEVSKIMKICSQFQVPVVPFGIGTSLEGHVIPIHGGISVDTSRMNKVLEIHESDLDAVVQPGVSRTQLNDELRASGLMFTVDPGADATLGGMAATRASGTNTVRYGTMRENVMALEVVLPDGTIIQTGSRARKSSAGYDLTHLFVGSEGTLGIITELTVRLFGQPETILAATCSYETVDDAVNTVIMAIQMGIPLARVELLDEMQMKGMNIFNPDLNLPEKPHLFLEYHGSGASVQEQVELFKGVGEEFGVSDFAWATKVEDRNRLWAARHNAYYAGKSLRKGCESVVTDCCVPVSELANCISRTKELIQDAGMIAPIVGHVGDGNFHLLILFDPKDPDEFVRAKSLASEVNRVALSFGGTVTGEHGVGTGKKEYMLEEHGNAYALMATLKRAIDPNNIMNPGKIFDIS
ncbi:FAD-binding protein [bacterium]|jgi:D-lactate dehydrogenase (cytochrome)|uniref:FAD-binding oxidoreductase n=4 Tax=Paracoccaceae TaxID=31989 RepID=UPI002302738D|nr:FAD-binding protein [Planktomarina temperata]MDA9291419.1 FAD-binding protein [bacterium]MDC3221762.1 FAD-binding protein [Planktomarina sp.]MDO7607433.1 FAD-binding protein [Loktanella sp.]MDA8540538.1 FAD-binding protein [Planktomarina temperata]